MILFGIVIYSGGIRQWGMVFICFVMMVCLAAEDTWRKDRLAIGAFILISLVQLVHNGRALMRDYQLPFTVTELAGEFIKEKVPENVPIVAINKFETAAVAAHADRQFFELPTGANFTYFRWLEKVYIPTQGELDLFAKFKNVGGIVLVSPSPIDRGRFPKAKLWKEFKPANYKLERMYVYSVPLK